MQILFILPYLIRFYFSGSQGKKIRQIESICHLWYSWQVPIANYECF